MFDAGLSQNSIPLHLSFWFLWTTRNCYMLRVLKALSDKSRNGSHMEYDDSLRYIGVWVTSLLPTGDVAFRRTRTHFEELFVT